MSQLEHIVGLIVVWVVSLAVTLVAVGGLLWAAGWLFWWFIREAMVYAGTWRVWEASVKTRGWWIEWATAVSRRERNDLGGIHVGGISQEGIEHIRAYFEKADPDNKLCWRPEVEKPHS